ncbi:phospholipase D family protein [Propioniciclava soli]|uniref:Phospholipase D family protein n=1 Tax=Propioniciclava soli TaxID=2775081 RepID=A0ABZ3C6N8_9ACTN
MLEPDSRVVLLDQLRPPDGFILDSAVATTFTLDLTTALVPPLAFASFQMRGATPDPVTALEAVRSCAERVSVFCQAGQISVPGQASDLMAFLEKMVHAVRRPRPGFLFHPKLWLVRYTADRQADRFRLLCSTRNLVDSAAWDAVVTLEGAATTERQPIDAPLTTLLRNLPELAVSPLPPDRLRRIHDLADRCDRVTWQSPEGTTLEAFHAWGVPGVTGAPDYTGSRRLVVSPFLNEDGLALLAPRRGDLLVSRADEFERLGPAALARFVKDNKPTTFVLDAATVVPTGVSDGPGPADEKEPGDSADGLQRAGLHAKITLVERNYRVHILVGSPNATSAAHGGNVEFAVELKGSRATHGIDQFVGENASLVRSGFLVPYAATGGAQPDPEEDARHALESALRQVASEPFILTVHPSGDGFDLTVTAAHPPAVAPGLRLDASLLTRPGNVLALDARRAAGNTFRGLPLADITAFLVLTLADASGLSVGSVVQCRLLNDPPDRLDAVLARQVNTPEKFLRFLALLLGLTDLDTLLGCGEGPGDGSAFAWSDASAGVPLLELLLRAVAGRRENLHTLRGLVDRLLATEQGRSTLPEGFEDLWRTIDTALLLLPEDAE